MNFADVKSLTINGQTVKSLSINGQVVWEAAGGFINFADAAVKAICVANWDTDNDGEISYEEAAAVTSIGTVFKDNTTITSFDELQYFTGLTTITARAFQGCSNLSSISFPSSVTTFGSAMLQDCTSLTSIVLPPNLTEVSNSSIRGCTSLTSITFGNNVTNIGQGAFLGDTNLDFSELPASTIIIDSNAFYNCSSLSLRSLPSGITKIDSFAFYRCTSIAFDELPSSLQYLGSNIFNGVNQIPKLKLLSTSVPTLASAITHIKIFVRADMVDAFKAADVWSSMASKIYSVEDWDNY